MKGDDITSNQIAALRACAAAGMTCEQTASALGWTYARTYCHAYRRDISFRPAPHPTRGGEHMRTMGRISADKRRTVA